MQESGTYQMPEPDLTPRPIDQLVGTTRTDAIKTKLCGVCDAPLTDFRDALSAREASQSGLCQSCQDAVFEGPEDDDEPDDILGFLADDEASLVADDFPCSQYRQASATDPDPGVDSPTNLCRCGYAWQLHRYDADGPTDDERAVLMQRVTDQEQANRQEWRRNLEVYCAQQREQFRAIHGVYPDTDALAGHQCDADDLASAADDANKRAREEEGT